MENNELKDKVLKNVRNRIVISNLEREESMKLSKRKQVSAITFALLILLSGSFITVNAATEGKIVENIKDTVKVIFVKADGTEQKVNGTTYKGANGDTWEKYETKTDNGEFTTEINKSLLERENMEIEDKTTETKEGDEIKLHKEIVVK